MNDRNNHIVCLEHVLLRRIMASDDKGDPGEEIIAGASGRDAVNAGPARAQTTFATFLFKKNTGGRTAGPTPPPTLLTSPICSLASLLVETTSIRTTIT